MEFYWKTNSRSYQDQNESEEKVGVTAQAQSKARCQTTKEAVIEAKKNAHEIE